MKYLIAIVVLAALAYGSAKLYLHGEVNEAMDTAVMMMAPFAEVEYDGVDSTVTGELTIVDARIRLNGFSDLIHIERLGIDTPSFLSLLEISDFITLQSEGFPEYIGFMVEGLHLPANADYYREFYEFLLEARGGADAIEAAAECTGKYGFSPAALAGLGYREQVLSLTVAIHNQPSNYSVELTSSARDMWQLNASLTLVGDLLAEISRGAAHQPKLQRLLLELTDHSLNERVVRYCAERGLSAKETRQAQLDMFRFYGASNGIEFDEYLMGRYQEYLGGKSTLVITAKPSEPLALSQIHLYRPSDVPALLNLSVSVR